MLKKSNRLKKADFDFVFKNGKRNHFPHLTVIYAPGDDLHASVVVGKKVAKSAVKRNLLRRRIYAQVHRQLVKNNVTGVFIILTKPSFATLPRKTANDFVVESIAAVQKSA